MKLPGLIMCIILLHSCKTEEVNDHPISEIQLPVSNNERNLQLTTLEFETREIDFGEINDSMPIIGEFHFTNTGEFPAQLKQVRPSCNCTVPEYEREVPRGASSIIHVNFTPKPVDLGTKIYQSSTVEIIGNFTDTIYLNVSALVSH